MPRTLDQTELLETFARTVHELYVRHTRVGYVLVLLLIPAGSMLDYFAYANDPEIFWRFFRARAICTLALLPLGVWAFRPSAWKWMRSLSTVLVLAPIVAMCWMVYITDGAASTYYAGLNLVILGTCVLLPYTAIQAIAYCVTVIGLYTMACLFNRHWLLADDMPLLVNNLFFIGLTSIICITACHYTTRWRWEDHRLRRELDHRNQELAEMDRLKSQFFANISHELRTPLTLIISPIDQLLHQQPPLPESVGETLVMARANALRLLKLINDLLEIIRLEEGRLKLDRKPLDLANFIAGCIDAFGHLARSKGLALQGEGSREPLIVMADRARLEKVMMNLLTNAIKFTPSGGAVIVRWSQTDRVVRVEVADTGIGIPEHELPHIFDRFRQVDGSATRQHQGVGLGLALVRELIEEHAGSVEVHSESGRGTRFLVELPIGVTAETGVPVVPSAAASQTTDLALVDTKADAYEDSVDPFAKTFRAAELAGISAALDEVAPTGEVGQGDRCVLIVDDEPDIRRYLVSLLCTDYRILQASDGVSGLKLAMEAKPDAVLLDLMLPGLNGLDFCRELRRHDEDRDIKILLLTARADEGSKIEALQRGADDFLTKPFSAVEIRTRLENLLRTVVLQRDLRSRNTALEDALAQLRAAEAQLIQAEKMNAMGTLAAGLLHEINNPLNYTLTAVQLARQFIDPSHEDVADTLNDIEEGMTRIRDIITDLRTFAYPDQASAPTPIDLENVVETALRFTASQRNGFLVVQDMMPGSVVLGSKTHLSQVMVNLLSNAFLAVQQVRDRREPTVGITTQIHDERLIVTVSDNGAGIAPEALSRIFEPFYTTNDVGKGMGLGLSICHTIISNLGGTIDIKSELGQGTQVSIDLPLSPQTAHTTAGELTYG